MDKIAVFLCSLAAGYYLSLEINKPKAEEELSEQRVCYDIVIPSPTMKIDMPILLNRCTGISYLPQKESRYENGNQVAYTYRWYRMETYAADNNFGLNSRDYFKPY